MFGAKAPRKRYVVAYDGFVLLKETNVFGATVGTQTVVNLVEGINMYAGTSGQLLCPLFANFLTF